MFTRILDFLRRMMALLPAIFTALLCIYFIDLFERIDEAKLHRQVEERDALMEFAAEIPQKRILIDFLETIDNFENNNVYLLDMNLDPVKDLRHTTACKYSLYHVSHPYDIAEFRTEMQKHKIGSFVHKLSPNLTMNFAYRRIWVEKRNYVLLIGIHGYPQFASQRELHIAIGLLLLFTTICNWIIIMYTKHVRYTYKVKASKLTKANEKLQKELQNKKK